MSLHPVLPPILLQPDARRSLSSNDWVWRSIRTALALFLGTSIAAIISGSVLIFVAGFWDFGPFLGLSIAVLASSIVSITQGSVFKDVLPRRVVWCISNALIFFIGLFTLLTYHTNLPLVGFLIGVTSGMVQWLHLRKYIRNAFVWMILNTLIWCSFLFILSIWNAWVLSE